MGIQERMMHWWLGRKSPEDIGSMMPEMMGEVADILGPDGMQTMMTTMMPEMMDGMFSRMAPEDMGSMMHEVMPQMMDGCFGRMDIDQRKNMLTMCRAMLDGVEQKYLTQAH